MKRYGRVGQSIRADIIETVSRYKRYGFTQEEICSKIGISVLYSHRMKKNSENVSTKNRLRIMDYMVMGKLFVMFETTEGKYTAQDSAVYLKENNNKEFDEEIIKNTA